MRIPYKCLRWGLVNRMGSTTCASCGASLTGAVPPPGKGPPATMAVPRPAQSIATHLSSVPASTVVPSRQLAVTASTVAGGSVSSAFGWTTLDGRVILLEPIYLAQPDFHWGRFLA